MKFKHFLVFTVVFALVALGTSCSKPSEKKLFGKWQLVCHHYRDSDDPEWWEIQHFDSDEFCWELKEDHTYSISLNGEVQNNGSWMYDKSTEKLYLDGEECCDVTECTASEMVWNSKEVHDDGFWAEQQWDFKKVK